MAIHAGANGGAAIPRGSPDAATIDDNFHSVVGAAAGADTGADLCAGVAGFQLKGSPVDLNFGGIAGAVILASAGGTGADASAEAVVPYGAVRQWQLRRRWSSPWC